MKATLYGEQPNWMVITRQSGHATGIDQIRSRPCGFAWSDCQQTHGCDVCRFNPANQKSDG